MGKDGIQVVLREGIMMFGYRYDISEKGQNQIDRKARYNHHSTERKEEKSRFYQRVFRFDPRRTYQIPGSGQKKRGLLDSSRQ